MVLTVRRASVLTLLLVFASTLLASPADARTSSGTQPVTAADRTGLELVAEAEMLGTHNDRRAARGVERFHGWTDVTTVARRWADRSSPSDFRHNPSYSRQYGHWRGAAENVAWRTIKPTSRGRPSASEVRRAAARLMGQWWNSSGHRKNWMNGSYDDIGVGASVRRESYRGTGYWVLMAVANFRDHNGSRIDGSAFPAYGSRPPNESSDASGRFGDVPGSHLFEGDIVELAESGVTRGCGGGEFCPDDRVTRGQMAAFLHRALGLPGGRATFRDTRGHLFEDDIAALARSGITKGCGGGRFCPDEPVTRGEMAAFLTRGLDLPAGNARFRDTRGHLFEDDIAALARRGITKGCGSGSTFCPNHSVTRAQMAAFLNRADVLD